LAADGVIGPDVMHKYIRFGRWRRYRAGCSAQIHQIWPLTALSGRMWCTNTSNLAADGVIGPDVMHKYTTWDLHGRISV